MQITENINNELADLTKAINSRQNAERVKQNLEKIFPLSKFQGWAKKLFLITNLSRWQKVGKGKNDMQKR